MKTLHHEPAAMNDPNPGFEADLGRRLEAHGDVLSRVISGDVDAAAAADSLKDILRAVDDRCAERFRALDRTVKSLMRRTSTAAFFGAAVAEGIVRLLGEVGQ